MLGHSTSAHTLTAKLADRDDAKAQAEQIISKSRVSAEGVYAEKKADADWDLPVWGRAGRADQAAGRHLRLPRADAPDDRDAAARQRGRRVAGLRASRITQRQRSLMTGYPGRRPAFRTAKTAEAVCVQDAVSERPTTARRASMAAITERD
jgi:hypothetical protein